MEIMKKLKNPLQSNNPIGLFDCKLDKESLIEYKNVNLKHPCKLIQDFNN